MNQRQPELTPFPSRSRWLPEWLPPEQWDNLLARYDRWIAQGCGYGVIHLTFANGDLVSIRGEEDAHV